MTADRRNSSHLRAVPNSAGPGSTPSISRELGTSFENRSGAAGNQWKLPASPIFAFRRALEEAEGVVPGLSLPDLAEGCGIVERLRIILDSSRIAALLSSNDETAKPAAPATPRLLSVKQVGARLGRSPTWVYRHQNDLPRVELPGGGVAFREDSLERWIAQREG